MGYYGIEYGNELRIYRFPSRVARAIWIETAWLQRHELKARDPQVRRALRRTYPGYNWGNGVPV